MKAEDGFSKFIPETTEEKLIPVEKVAVGPEEMYPRSGIDRDKVSEYFERLQFSEPPPIKAAPLGDGSYLLVDGNHRLSAIRKAKREAVMAEILNANGHDEGRMVALALYYNSGNALHLNVEEIKRIVHVLYSEFSYSVDRLATLTSRCPRTIYNWTRDIRHEKRKDQEESVKKLKEEGKTQEEISDITGIPQRTVSDILNRPLADCAKTAKSTENELEVSPDYNPVADPDLFEKGGIGSFVSKRQAKQKRIEDKYFERISKKEETIAEIKVGMNEYRELRERTGVLNSSVYIEKHIAPLCEIISQLIDIAPEAVKKNRDASVEDLISLFTPFSPFYEAITTLSVLVRNLKDITAGLDAEKFNETLDIWKEVCEVRDWYVDYHDGDIPDSNTYIQAIKRIVEQLMKEKASDIPRSIERAYERLASSPQDDGPAEDDGDNTYSITFLADNISVIEGVGAGVEG